MRRRESLRIINLTLISLLAVFPTLASAAGKGAARPLERRAAPREQASERTDERRSETAARSGSLAELRPEHRATSEGRSSALDGQFTGDGIAGMKDMAGGANKYPGSRVSMSFKEDAGKLDIIYNDPTLPQHYVGRIVSDRQVGQERHLRVEVDGPGAMAESQRVLDAKLGEGSPVKVKSARATHTIVYRADGTIRIKSRGHWSYDHLERPSVAAKLQDITKVFSGEYELKPEKAGN